MALWHRLLHPSHSNAPAAAGNDADFLVHLDHHYRRPLTNYFEKRLREAYDVEDLVQEVFIRLSHRQTFQDIDYLEGYVFQTAANVMRDRARRQVVRQANRHEPLENCELPATDLSPERVIQGKQQLELAIAALSELPERTQQVFVLRLYEGLTYEEIAERQKMSVEGVRFHLRKAKGHITRSVEQDA